MKRVLKCLFVLVIALGQVSCKTFSSLVAYHQASAEAVYTEGPDTTPESVIVTGVAITLRDQKMTYFQNGKVVREYPISSSKFGIGNSYGSCKTPTGMHIVRAKMGEGQPKGMVFKGCRPTGEIVAVDAAGRDPIVTRVVQLSGLEKENSQTYRRHVYLHGTPEERFIGQPSSYGCIRMKSDDIVEIYPYLHRGTPVVIETCSQGVYVDAVERVVAPAPAPTIGQDKAAASPIETIAEGQGKPTVVRKAES